MSERTANLNAVDALVRARAAHDQIVSPENDRFIYELVKQALDSLRGASPAWAAEAWALRADVLASDYLHRWNDAGRDQLDEAQDAIDRALALDSTLALAHYACGFVRRAKGSHEQALTAFDAAISFDRNFARAYAQKGNELINLGRPGEAPPLVQKAIDLSPSDPSLAMFYWIMGRAYFMAGFYRDAIPWLEKSVIARPTVWYNWTFLIGAHALIYQIYQAEEVMIRFLARPRFAGYTLETVLKNEQANPNDNELVKKGRENLRTGLLKAGLPEK